MLFGKNFIESFSSQTHAQTVGKGIYWAFTFNVRNLTLNK